MAKYDRFERFMIILNLVLGIMSLVAIGVSSSAIFNYDDAQENFFEKATYAEFLIAGLIGLFLTMFACSGIKKQQMRYNRIFCYFIGLTVLLLVNAFALNFYLVFIRAIETTGGQVSESDIENAFNERVSEEINDYILSSYTSCCVGCDPSVTPSCKGTIVVESPEEGPAFCEPGLVKGVDDATCAYPQDCAALNKTGFLLDQGCYISALNGIPPYSVSERECYGFEQLDLVGPASEGKCGGGSPREYVEDVTTLLSENKQAIMAVLILSLMVVGLLWLGSLKILLCPKVDDKYGML